MRRSFLLLLLTLVTGFTLFGQDRSSATFGLDPGDAAAVRQFRARMDKVRKRRPVVALVLSGGGAKGAAHVGALKYIEKYKIPVDMVVGTSIGGLVGGMYALGYTPDFLDSLMRNLDWDWVLSDQVEREFFPFSRIQYKERFALSFPFYYSKKDFQDRLASDLGYNNKSAGKLDLSAQADAGALVSSNLMGSLPSGFVYGQNVSKLIASLTAGYADSTDFFRFPIPFACVATDIVSGKAKVWHSGNINTALRSTMSIPGLFAPVRSRGMVLVDGGMRNNFPVDIARDLGADIVIGVDLSTKGAGVTDIQNLLDVVWSSIDMFGGDSFERNVKMVDLRIKPDLEGYGMLSFNSVAIDTMIRRGFRAAMEKDSELAAIRRWIGDEKFRRSGKSAVDISRQNVLIDSVQIAGVSASDANYLRSKLYIKGGSIVNRYETERAVSSIFASGAYDFVNYAILGKEEPYRLLINCKKGPMHRLGVGIRLDTEELVSLLLNVGLNTQAMQGSSLDMTAKVGYNPSLELHYAYNLPRIPTLNARALVRWTDRNNVIWGGDRFSITYFWTTQELYLSNMRWSNFDVRAGLKNDYFNIRQILTTNIVGDYDLSLLARDYPGAFVDLTARTLDNAYFPHDGFSSHIRSELLYRGADGREYPPFFGTLEVQGKMAVPMGARLAFIPQGNLRFIFGEDIALPYSNVLGGDMPGRYVDQQIPFIGIGKSAYRRNYLVSLRGDLRLEVASNNYVSAIFNYARDFQNFSLYEEGENVFGAGLEYAYNSIVGPLKAQLFWSSLTRTVGFYAGLGFYF